MVVEDFLRMFIVIPVFTVMVESNRRQFDNSIYVPE